jgi:hypothetical protein
MSADRTEHKPSGDSTTIHYSLFTIYDLLDLPLHTRGAKSRLIICGSKRAVLMREPVVK